MVVTKLGYDLTIEPKVDAHYSYTNVLLSQGHIILYSGKLNCNDWKIIYSLVHLFPNAFTDEFIEKYYSDKEDEDNA